MESSLADGLEESDQVGEPRSSRSQVRGLLEIRHTTTGRVWTKSLFVPRLVIGRSAGADVVLDDASVSPMHAELVCGPLGRWCIHDLGSEDGTYLHGRKLQEQMLALGDEFGVGVFRLRLRTRSSSELRLALPSELSAPATVRFGPSLPPPEASQKSLVADGVPAAVSISNQIGAAHLWKVMSLGRHLMQIEDTGARRSLLCQFAVGDSFPGDSAAVLRVLGPKTVRTIEGPLRRHGPDLPLFLSDRVTRQLWETRQPVFLSTERAAPGRLTGSPRQAVTVCPLQIDSDFLDALYVELPSEFGGPEWCSLVAMLAEAFQQAQVVWDMRSHVRESSSVERELEMARQIQQEIVPTQARFDWVLRELDIVVGFEPCHWVGGDYVDAIPMPDGRVLLAIADVCGKGIQAALVASSLHTLVRATVDADRPLADLMQRINRHLCHYLPDHVFVTMLCVAVNPKSGEMEVLSAGHPPAMVADPYGRVRSIDVGHNVALGMMEASMVSGKYLFGPEHVILLYTDGLTEAVDEHRNPLGAEKLAEHFSRIAAAHFGRGTYAMREALLAALSGFRGSRLAADDSTFLLARRCMSLRPSDPKTSRPGD
jgi:serine phosphatase RsbU (regulator of sigma subunit)